MNCKEKIIEGLNANLLANDENTEILEGIGEIANSFDCLDKALKQLVFTNERTKSSFAMLAALACVYMGYKYQCEITYGRGHWDLRNEASSQYCSKHRNELEQIFNAVSGIEIRYVEDAGHQAFRRDCLLVRDRGGYRTLVGEIEAFSREHPTIQQKMMGTFIRILGEMYPNYGLEQVGFPFI